MLSDIVKTLAYYTSVFYETYTLLQCHVNLYSFFCDQLV